ncbi:hypothetical protein DFS34DRAFT_596517 [Phlyctochytrium arcticum]|nr:hypothetical protein DFS34DRAFT_596517 [Phlyctochytrium arcticum]
MAVVRESAKFAVHVAMRDRSCILTGDSNPAHLVGAYIVPFSWSKWGLDGLPEEVKDILASTRLGLDDISKGLFLSSTLHDTFDNGSWSVVFRWRKTGVWANCGDEVDLDQGKWVVVPITEDSPADIIGKALAIPDGVRGSGGTWKDGFPPAKLLWFHLKAALLKHCHGASGGQDTRKGGRQV